RRLAERLQEGAEEAPDVLPHGDRGGRGGAEALVRLDGRAGHVADALPVAHAALVLAGHPEDDAARVRAGLAQDALLQLQCPPIRFAHPTGLPPAWQGPSASEPRPSGSGEPLPRSLTVAA